MQFTTIQAYLELNDKPAETATQAREVMGRVGLGDAHSITNAYREGMQPEEIDASSGIWNIWVPLGVSMQLTKAGQIERDGLNAHLHAEMP